jgi:hypothetical protein
MTRIKDEINNWRLNGSFALIIKHLKFIESMISLYEPKIRCRSKII